MNNLFYSSIRQEDGLIHILVNGSRILCEKIYFPWGYEYFSSPHKADCPGCRAKYLDLINGLEKEPNNEQS